MIISDDECYYYIRMIRPVIQKHICNTGRHVFQIMNFGIPGKTCDYDRVYAQLVSSKIDWKCCHTLHVKITELVQVRRNAGIM